MSDERDRSAVLEAGHRNCGGWSRGSRDGRLLCACGMTIVAVGAHCIAYGQPRPAANAIALAVEEAIPGAEWVVAGAEILRFTLDGRRFEYGLPESARSFTAAIYSSGADLRPFAFAIDLDAPLFSYGFRLARPVANQPVAPAAVRPVSVLALARTEGAAWPPPVRPAPMSSAELAAVVLPPAGTETAR